MDHEQPNNPDGEVKKLRYKFLNSLIAVIASIVALVTAIYSNQKAQNAEDEVRELKNLYEVAEFVGGDLSIDHPKSGAQIADSNLSVYGSWSGKISALESNNMWLFAQQGNLYFPANGKVILTAKQQWSVDNLFLGIKGDFTLLLLIADEDDSLWIERWIRDTNGRALSGLPSDILILDKVDITRI